MKLKELFSTNSTTTVFWDLDKKQQEILIELLQTEKIESNNNFEIELLSTDVDIREFIPKGTINYWGVFNKLIIIEQDDKKFLACELILNDVINRREKISHMFNLILSNIDILPYFILSELHDENPLKKLSIEEINNKFYDKFKNLQFHITYERKEVE